MLRRIRRPLRGGAAVLSLACTTMVLASTQPPALSTPDLGLAALVFHDVTTNPAGDAMVNIFDFKTLAPYSDNEVLTVGGGPDEAATLAELLDSTDQSDNVLHINYEFDANAKVQVLNVFTDANALTKRDSKPSVDPSGGVNCTGATICRTDPRTRITTLTYPDGVVAVVERINDVAVVAYKTLGAGVLGNLDTSRGNAPAPAPRSAPPAPASTEPAPAPAAAPAPADLPAAPAASTGPRLNVLRPAPDFTPSRSGTSSTSRGAKSDLSDTTDKFVNDVLTQVSDTVNHLLNREAAPSGVGTTGSPPPTGEQ